MTLLNLLRPLSHPFSRARLLACVVSTLLCCLALPAVAAAPVFEDTLAQRVLACTACHGAQGRAAPDGYYPRIAGKPAGYLYNQLANFHDGRRNYRLMTQMVEPLTERYLREIAEHFAALDLPYPAPAPVLVTAQELQRGEQLALRGDAARQVPACVKCHGAALTGVQPSTPGLLGLPRDYLNAQMGAWRNGQRKAHAPDCMATITRRLSESDVSAVSGWLASQRLPANPKPAWALPAALPLDCGSAYGASPASTPVSPAAAADNATVARGRYLATLGNCELCHTLRGGVPYSGGRGIVTPFGTVFGSNLTPSAAGLGAWSADDFWRALHQGQSRDGRWLVPAFPINNTTHITRADSDAIYAYLRSLAPDGRAAPAHQLRWPYNTQLALRVWRALYFEEGNAPAPTGNATQSDTDLQRGAYLVRSLAHCSACHAQRNALGANRNMLDLAGGLIPLQNWYAPSLANPAEAGLQDWAVEDIVTLFQSGRAGAAQVSGPMADVVQHSTQHWRAADLRAMAVYLQQLPRTASPGPAPAAAMAMPAPAAGAKLFEKHCADCHGKEGQGRRTADGRFAYPPLAGNRAVTLASPANLVQIVMDGGFGPVTPGHPRPFGMPPFVLTLSDSEIAAILTHLRTQWGNQAAPVSALEVQQLRGSGMR